MFQAFLLNGYSRRTLNYLERIVVSDLTHMVSATDPMTISVETLMINSMCSLMKKFNGVIHVNT